MLWPVPRGDTVRGDLAAPMEGLVSEALGLASCDEIHVLVEPHSKDGTSNGNEQGEFPARA